MKKSLSRIISMFLVLLGVLLGTLINTLEFWILGKLILWLLKINFNWTFRHGLAVAILYFIMILPTKASYSNRKK